MASEWPIKLTGLSEEDILKFVPGFARLGQVLQFEPVKSNAPVVRALAMPANVEDVNPIDPGARTRWWYIES